MHKANFYFMLDYQCFSLCDFAICIILKISTVLIKNLNKEQILLRHKKRVISIGRLAERNIVNINRTVVIENQLL